MMLYNEPMEVDDPRETPGEWTGGLPIDAGFITLAVVITSLLMAIFLSQLTTQPASANLDRLSRTEETSTGKNVSAGKGGIAPLFTPEVQHWAAKIVSWSEAQGLDPNLVATVMQIESCGHADVKSSAGAMGLFQVMPFHFSGDEDAYKPNINARRGLDYLKRALEAGNGDIRLALAGYNGGITGASRAESDWPAETQRYVYWGLKIYEDASKGRSNSERLGEWLAAGGASLCRSAAANLGIGD